MRFYQFGMMAIFGISLTSCGSGGSSSSAVAVVSVSGTITYDRVPHNSNTNGLNYSATIIRPVRGVTVQALNSNNDIIATTATDQTGGYILQVPNNSEVTIRVLAQMLTAGTPAWDFRVVDNNAGNAQWAMGGNPFIATGNNISNKNYHAASGWNGTSYTGPRTAAPFAIIDNVYDAVQKILAAQPNSIFPALTLNWSPNNSIASIGTSYFTTQGGRNIFILGMANQDTDEYDDHVILHEFGHYIEDAFSRSDSIGGPHSEGNRLDMTVAFGEGWGNAFSGMISDDPVYIDSSGTNQGTGFIINVENSTNTNPGWYSEGSIQSILYDLYDSANDAADNNVSLGFAPLYNVLANSQRTTPALTSIFSFISALKANYTADATVTSGINAIVNAQSIVGSTIDAFGTTETNNGGITNGTIPVYLTLSSGNAITNVCTTDANGGYNRLGASRYLRITPVSSGSRTIIVRGGVTSNFDMVLIQSGTILQVNENTGTSETLTYNFTANMTYVIAVYDFNLLDSTTYNGQSCFDISMN